ncbi:MAG: hypothetical protein KDC92_03475, partial [Bacteroidetes bacterium]|nr:hypothetical protein [Bacteroidota bacterium]
AAGFSNILSHTAKGANLTSQMQQELQKATKGDVVVFTDIKALGKDNLTKDVPAMVFKVD